MQSETLRRAAEIWDYFASFRSTGRSDAIVVCCSYDLRVCDHACDLLQAGIAETLVFSGKRGAWTRHLWNKTEAETFFERAMTNGVSADRVLLETEATNFGENIAFARALIPEARAVTFVTKPNALLRAQLTAAVQWPEVRAYLSCPRLRFPDEVSATIGLWGVIHELVGDVERILQYPALGFQAGHDFPPRILDDWRYLRDAGFTGHSPVQSETLAAGMRRAASRTTG